MTTSFEGEVRIRTRCLYWVVFSAVIAFLATVSFCSIAYVKRMEWPWLGPLLVIFAVVLSSTMMVLLWWILRRGFRETAHLRVIQQIREGKIDATVAACHAQEEYKTLLKEEDSLGVSFGGSSDYHPNLACYASFPGTYGNAWNRVSQAMSFTSCCVFYPKNHSYYGEHMQAQGEDCCLCMLPMKDGSGLGGLKKYGCKWFWQWQQNIKKAVEKEVVYLTVITKAIPQTKRRHLKCMNTPGTWDENTLEVMKEYLGNSQYVETAYIIKKYPSKVLFRSIEDFAIDILQVETKVVFQPCDESFAREENQDETPQVSSVKSGMKE